MTAAGCLLWAFMTALFGSASTLHHGMAAWAVNGLGLAMVSSLRVLGLHHAICTDRLSTGACVKQDSALNAIGLVVKHSTQCIPPSFCAGDPQR